MTSVPGSADEASRLLEDGDAHTHVLKTIGDAPDPAVNVTLVTPVELHRLLGDGAGYVAGHYALAECVIDFAPLAKRALARVVRSSASARERPDADVICANGEIVPYDVLSIDVGSRPFIGGAKGVAEHAVACGRLSASSKGGNACSPG